MTIRVRRVDRTGKVDLRGIAEPRRYYRIEQRADGSLILSPLATEGIERVKEEGQGPHQDSVHRV